LGEPLAVRPRSAPALTVVFCVTLLGPSPAVEEVAIAVLLSVLPPFAVTVITMSTIFVAAPASVPKAHVTV